MPNREISSRDHNYSEMKLGVRNQYKDGYTRISNNSSITMMKSSNKSRETFGGQIKDINELKKITPRVKLLAHDATSLNELTKISLHTRTPGDQVKFSLSEQAKQELKKYCRTCAGLKLPLVDMFGEKGIQMRLSQQMRHLEEINPSNSLSTQMCMDCICDLKMSYKFFMQIKKAEVKLKSIHVTLMDAAAKKLENRETQPLASSQEVQKQGVKSCDVISTSTSRVCDKASSMVPAKESSQDAQNNATKENEKQKIEFAKTDTETEEVAADHQSDDNDSIEEFDPDDPPFDPDSSEVESDDEMGAQDTPRETGKDSTKVTVAQSNESQLTCVTSENKLTENAARTDLNQTTRKYDTESKLRAQLTKEEEALGYEIKHKDSNGSDAKEPPKQPNILKRKPTSLKKEIPMENADENAPPSNLVDDAEGQKDPKIPKLDVNNPLAVNSNSEDGIMYVTVKGSKPNEILLVKVKKMDKPLDRKDDKHPLRKIIDFKPVEKVLKRYESLSKEKDMILERKKTEKREQIIEEQIEEYKKKREKVLGSQSNSPLSSRIEERVTRRSEQSDDQKSVEDTTGVKSEVEDDTSVQNIDESTVSENDDSIKDKSVDEKIQCTTEEYLTCLTRLKQKWEEAKQKKEILQKELKQSYSEGNTEKLARILGEKEKNLQDFQDYLKQRKIVIEKLKDEDIISLYEDRNNAIARKKFPDLIDQTLPVDYLPNQDYMECDYCLQTFCIKEVIEEHLKSHDFKIMHYCEDCGEEFSTHKAKRNHNLICIKKLLCKYCDAMLESKGKKRQHEQKHCDDIFGQLCDICGEKFKHQGTLDQHIKTQHMNWEKIYQCPKCPKKFAFKQKLSFHVKSVHTTMRAYLCEDCGADFKNPASLRHHKIRKHQPVGNKRECPVCHKLVPFYSLSKHMHTHKAYTIQCPHCDKMFKNTSTLKQHVRIHEDQRQFRCDTCGVGFNRRDGLRLHMRVHQKSDSRGLKECSCQVCGEKFPSHSTLVIHRNRVHKDGRQYTCHICNRSMISTRSLEWHMSHIHNESIPGILKEGGDSSSEKKRVSCYHCNKTFKTEMILRTHIKNTHMEKDPMKCLDCNETFTSEVRLRHHMMITHNRLEGTLACSHCPKRFVNQLRLKTHMISHSEERPFTCEICGFNLKTKIQLIKHHQNRHSDERPLQCRYCPWRCKQVSALVCHERTHTNERPYSCSVCRQRFKYLGDKNKHERRHESLGGSGFKRIVPGRNIKQNVKEESSCSDQEQEDTKSADTQETEELYDEQSNQQFQSESAVKFERPEITEQYEQVYEQEYEETSREASEAAEVIMNMEDTTAVYTEEVTADNIEPAEIMADEMMTSEILQSGAVVHLQQQDDTGKIQVIPVMLSLPDLSDANAEVNLATASIMYNN